MPRTIVIRIVVDNRDAVNAIKVQREEAAKLRDEVKFQNEELRKNEIQALRVAAASDTATKSQDSLSNSFVVGYLKGQLISKVFGDIVSSFEYFVSGAAKIELSLAKITAVTGNSKTEIESLSDTIFALGRNTSVSDNSIADAALELSKLGFAGKELEIALAGVTRLSAILGDSLETTGNLVGGVIQTFDLSAEQAATVADKLFVATGKSASNIEGFRIAFGLAGNVAHDAGITFEQLSAAIAALSNQGIRASTIGTGLRNFIGELSKEGSKAQKALGGSIEELGLLGAMNKLNELKLTPGSLIEIFGKPGSPVASGLSHANDEYTKFLDNITNSKDVLKGAGDIINDTLLGSIEKLKNNLLELFKTSTEKDATVFKEFFGFIADKFARINELKAEIKTAKEFIADQQSHGLNANVTLGLDKDFTFNKDNASIDLFTKKLKAYREEAQKDKEETNALTGALDKVAQGVGTVHENITTPKPHPFDKNAALDQIESIKVRLETFKAGKGDFDFKKYEDQLFSLSNALGKFGDKKDQLKALEELISLQKEEQAIQDKAAQKHKIEEEFITGEDKTVANIGKELFPTKHKVAKKDLDEAAKSQDRYNKFIIETNESLDDFNSKLGVTKEGFNLLSSASDIFATSIISAFDSKVIFNFKDAFFQLFESFVQQLIAMEIRVLAFKAAIAIFNLLPAGKAATVIGSSIGEAAASGFEANFGPDVRPGDVVAANGFDGIVRGPQHFLTGEAGPERVTITPLGKSGAKGDSGNTTIIVQGDVFNAEKLIDKIAATNEKSRTRFV